MEKLLTGNLFSRIILANCLLRARDSPLKQLLSLNSKQRNSKLASSYCWISLTGRECLNVQITDHMGSKKC